MSGWSCVRSSLNWDMSMVQSSGPFQSEAYHFARDPLAWPRGELSEDTLPKHRSETQGRQQETRGDLQHCNLDRRRSFDRLFTKRGTATNNHSKDPRGSKWPKNLGAQRKCGFHTTKVASDTCLRACRKCLAPTRRAAKIFLCLIKSNEM